MQSLLVIGSSRIWIYHIFQPFVKGNFEHYYEMSFSSKITCDSFNRTALALLLQAQLGKSSVNIWIQWVFHIFGHKLRCNRCLVVNNNNLLLNQRLILHPIMLLHKLGTVQTTSNHLYAQWHRPMPVYPSSVRLRHHKEQPTGHLWVEWCGALRPVQRPEEQVSSWKRSIKQWSFTNEAQLGVTVCFQSLLLCKTSDFLAGMATWRLFCLLEDGTLAPQGEMICRYRHTWTL